MKVGFEGDARQFVSLQLSYPTKTFVLMMPYGVILCLIFRSLYVLNKMRP